MGNFLAFESSACVFVLNISSEWAAHYFALRSQTPLLSNRAADMTLTELHFSQVLVPAGVFVLATGQPSPQKQFIIVVWLLRYFLSMQQAQYSIYFVMILSNDMSCVGVFC